MIDVDFLDTTYQEIITTFVLNKILQFVGVLWIIENQKELKYDMDIQNSYWSTGVPWYNTYIYKKLHENLFEGFIINSRTERHQIMCSIDSYEKEHQSSICDDGNIGGGYPLTINSTT